MFIWRRLGEKDRFFGEIYSNGHYISSQGELDVYRKYNGDWLLGGYHDEWTSAHINLHVAHYNYLFSSSDV